MRLVKFQMAAALLLFQGLARGQGVQPSQIAIGSSSGLVGSSELTYDGGEMVFGSAMDNYLTFHNGGATGSLQFDQSGQFTWRTPGNSSAKKMQLTNGGILKIGEFYTMLGGTPPNPNVDYKLMIGGGACFIDQVNTLKEMNDALVASGGGYTSSNANYYQLKDNISTGAYHAAQENHFVASNSAQNTPSGATLLAYQSAAQKNEVYFFKEAYTAQNGPGQTMSVQTNSFYPDGGSTANQFINTYIRTHVGSGTNSIGTYYSLFMEEPYGQGDASQLGNYWGVYQQSAAAKNFFGGKVWIGAMPSGGVTTDAQLAVNGNVYCSS